MNRKISKAAHFTRRYRRLRLRVRLGVKRERERVRASHNFAVCTHWFLQKYSHGRKRLLERAHYSTQLKWFFFASFCL